MTTTNLREMALRHGRLLAAAEAATDSAEAERLASEAEALLDAMEARQRMADANRAGECAGSGKRRPLTLREATERTALCGCGKRLRVRPVNDGQGMSATLPRHKPGRNH